MKNNNEVSSVIKSAKKVAIGAGVVSGVAAFSVLSGGQVLAEELPADPANLEMVVTEEAQQEVNNVSNEELAAANEVIANSVEDINVEAETSDLADKKTPLTRKRIHTLRTQVLKMNWLRTAMLQQTKKS